MSQLRRERPRRTAVLILETFSFPQAPAEDPHHSRFVTATRRPIRPALFRQGGGHRRCCTCRATASPIISSPQFDVPPSQDEAEMMDNLSRAGKRLIGFCRTNLSSGWKAAAIRSCFPSAATSCAIISSCTRWRTTCRCPSARRIPLCSTPAPRPRQRRARFLRRGRCRPGQSQRKSPPIPWPILPKPEHRATKRSAPSTPAILIGCAPTSFAEDSWLNTLRRTPNGLSPSSNSPALAARPGSQAGGTPQTPDQKASRPERFSSSPSLPTPWRIWRTS
jgi:hypothetical protein